MSRKFSEFWQNASKGQISAAYFEYNQVRGKYPYICFVEGNRDKHFYSFFLHDKLKCDKEDIYYIRCNSKNNVVAFPYHLKDKYNIKIKKYKNYIFIVDRDYDSEILEIEEDIRSRLTVLPCYSIENYLFYERNFQRVLQYLSLSRRSEYIQDRFQQFIYTILEYEVLLWLKVNKYPFIDSQFDKANDELEKVVIKKNEDIIPRRFTTICSKVKQSFINSDANHRNLFYTKLNEFSKHPEYIRGHDLERYFDGLLKLEHKSMPNVGKIMSEEELIRQFDIDIDIK